MKISKVYTEYQEHPIGMDEVHPRFSWELQAEENDCSQSAYRLEVVLEKSGSAKAFLNDGGVIDGILGRNLHLMSTNSALFWVVCVLVDVWKEMGWSAIIYLSAMVGIDQGLYEATKVDGENRFQRMWHITLQGIKPTVIVSLIM